MWGLCCNPILQFAIFCLVIHLYVSCGLCNLHNYVDATRMYYTQSMYIDVCSVCQFATKLCTQVRKHTPRNLVHVFEKFVHVGSNVV